MWILSERERHAYVYCSTERFFFPLKRCVDTVRQRTTHARHFSCFTERSTPLCLYLYPCTKIDPRTTTTIRHSVSMHQNDMPHYVLTRVPHVCCSTESGIYVTSTGRFLFFCLIEVCGNSQRGNDSRTSLVLLHTETFLTFVAAQRAGTYVTFGCVDTIRERATRARDFTCERERLAYVTFLGYMHIYVSERECT